MIDMHSHILYKVDDGPETIKESIALLEHAAKDGITDIISTSHAFHPHFHVPAETVKNQVNELTNLLNKLQIPINLHTGHELRLTDTLPRDIINKTALTLADSRYILLELPSYGIPLYTTQILHQLIEMDLVPIIAHPERNRAIAENPNRLYELIMSGALGQVTAGSLSGYFGKRVQKTALKLIEANMIHAYGSDMHNISTRPALFKEGLNFLEKVKQYEVIDIFMENNRKIVNNYEIVQNAPLEIRKSKIWGIF